MSSTLIVAISRQIGSGGSFVGQAVARQLGIRFVDREVLERAAKVLGRDERELEGLEERVASVWSRMATMLTLGAAEAPYVAPPLPTMVEDDLFVVESQVLREIAAHESAVIVGRAAAWVLRSHPRIVRVFLHAPEDWRVKRVRETYSLPDEAAARQVVRESDAHRSRFMQTLRGGPWVDPGQYDLCVDTSRIGLDVSAALIALAARSVA